MSKFLVSKYGKNKIAKLLLKYNYEIKVGDILAGKVIGKERKEILIDLGLKQVALLLNNEISTNSKTKINKITMIPEFSEFIIVYHNFQTNLTIVSLRKLHYLRLWERFKQIDFNNTIILSKLKKSVWGGKLVKFDGLNIFIPNFHLPKYFRRKQIIKNNLVLKILEVKNYQQKIIGSSRLAIFKKYSPSIVIGLKQTCYIIGIKPFGIFVNIHGFRSLLHISEISNKKIKNLNTSYKIGDQLTVKVLYINNSKAKIAVSLK